MFSGFEFRDCLFDHCDATPVSHPDWRYIFRDLLLQDCAQRDCSINTAIIEDVTVDGLGRAGEHPFFTWATVFRHVVLKGRITALKLNHWVSPFAPKGKKQQVWDKASVAFYATVNWALDISEARFTSAVELHAVPGRLIRRDPETQILVTRTRAMESDWTALDWGGSAQNLAQQWFLESGIYDDVVLVAPKAAPYFKDDLKALEMLRCEGLAEPD